MTSTIGRLAALAKRDAVLELSYPFQLGLRLFAVLMSVVMFFYLGELVGQSEQLDRYRAGYFDFVLIGLVVMGFSLACVNSLSRSIQSAQADGTFEILLATPTGLPTLMAGTLAVPLLLATVEGAVYGGVGMAVSGISASGSSLLLAGALLALTLGTFASIGVFSAAFIVLTKRGDPFSSVVLQVSNLLAGAVFPVVMFPDWVQLVARFVPAFHGLEGSREVLLAGAGAGEVSDHLAALVLFNLILLPASFWALSSALRLARVTGTLGNR